MPTRSISQIERGNLVKRFCPEAKAHQPIMIGTVNDPEALRYAEQILNVVVGCGITTINQQDFLHAKDMPVLGSVPIAAITGHLIQAAQEGLDHGGLVLAERCAMGGY